MGAYLSQPVTDKETFVGAKGGFLEFGGSSMQVRLLDSMWESLTGQMHPQS